MKKTLFILVCLFFLVAAPVQAAGEITAKIVVSAPTPDAAIMNASEYKTLQQEAVAERNWAQVLAITSEASRQYPGDADFVCVKGYSLRKLGMFNEAVDQVTKGCMIDPKPVRFANRGYAYLALGNYSAALSDAETGISLDPSYTTSFGVKALALQGLGKNADALTAIGQALTLDPNSAHYWHIRGNLLAASGDCEGARVALGKSLAIDPNYDLPWPGFVNASTRLASLDSQCIPVADENQTGSTGPQPARSPTKSPLGGIAVIGVAIALVAVGMKR